MPKAIRVHQVGGPEVLRWEEVPSAPVGPNDVRVQHRFAGLNFIDVYHRTGLYKLPLPFTPGQEASGVVAEVGSDVQGFRAGDRVAYAGGSPGAYSEERVMPADRLVPLPPDIDDRTAAAMFLKGMTAQYLLRQTYKVQPGDTILFHAAAGGVGLIACQWAKQIGAHVIGTVGNDQKAELARANGCEHVIVYTRESIVDRVKEITRGKGVPVVYDSVGKDTFNLSLDCLRPRGLLVLFGQSSGPVPPFDPSILAAKGSLYLTRPVLFAYTASRADLLASANELVAVVKSGAVKVRVDQTFPLAEVARAHQELEARRTTGSSLLQV